MTFERSTTFALIRQWDGGGVGRLSDHVKSARGSAQLTSAPSRAREFSAQLIWTHQALKVLLVHGMTASNVREVHGCRVRRPES